MKPRVNLFLLIGGIIFLILIAASGYLLFCGFSELAGTEARLADRRAVLSQYFQKNPFPSPENVARERDNSQKLSDLYNILLADLSKEQIRPAGFSPSTFMSILGEKRNKMHAKAKASGTELSSDLGFGFEKYLAGSSLPAPEHVPRLTQQLMIIEQLCDTLFAEHIQELSLVKREVFESVAPSATIAPGGRARPAASTLSVASAARLAKAGVLGTNDLFTAFEFSLDFSAKEKSLVSIMDRLASSGLFIVVRNIQMSKGAPDVAEQASVPAGAAEGDEKPAVEAKAVAARDLPRQQRMVSGPAREVPVKIEMDLEVYRFREPVQ